MIYFTQSIFGVWMDVMNSFNFQYFLPKLNY